MNTALSGFLVYILIACLVVLVLLRFLKSKREGGRALIMEIMYLCVYAFMGGIFLCFILEKLPSADWLWGVMFLFLFWGGFIIRSLPLFKSLSGSSKNNSKDE